jgi:hypothetical protein
VPDLTTKFREFAGTTSARAPLYAALSAAIADDDRLAGLLQHAPPDQRLPVLLFAAVHRVLLDHDDAPLAAWYANLTEEPRPADDRELVPAFTQFVDAHHDAVVELISTRSTQTNEVGRCALFLPAFDLVHREVRRPLAHVDVGTSGGLNLLLDHYRYRYRWASASPGDGEAVEVGAPSPVQLTTDVRGAMPVPSLVPPIAAAIGIDREPIDVTDPDEARWLEACVWPDQPDRFARLVAAIELFRAVRPTIERGDAVASLAPALARVTGSGHPVVTNSWVLNYFRADQRTAYLAALDELGTTQDLSWVYLEAPALIPELPVGPDPRDPSLSVLSLVRWRSGERHVAHLATCHPHGYWIHWR